MRIIHQTTLVAALIAACGGDLPSKNTSIERFLNLFPHHSHNTFYPNHFQEQRLHRILYIKLVGFVKGLPLIFHV